MLHYVKVNFVHENKLNISLTGKYFHGLTNRGAKVGTFHTKKIIYTVKRQSLVIRILSGMLTDKRE